MDNEYVIVMNGVEYHFRLKSQRIVNLEKQYGKNIFEIVQEMSFNSMADFIGASLISPTNINKLDLMDILLENYSLQEISETVMTGIAVKSGLLKQADVDEALAEQSKN